MDKNGDERSVQSNISLKTNKQTYKDTIPMRIDFIKNLIGDRELAPLVDFDNTMTENFTGRENDLDSGDSYDTRILLKKRTLDFKEMITKIGGVIEYVTSGTTGHTFKGTAEDEHGTFEYAVKVVHIRKKRGRII